MIIYIVHYSFYKEETDPRLVKGYSCHFSKEEAEDFVKSAQESTFKTFFPNAVNPEFKIESARVKGKNPFIEHEIIDTAC